MSTCLTGSLLPSAESNSLRMSSIRSLRRSTRPGRFSSRTSSVILAASLLGAAHINGPWKLKSSSGSHTYGSKTSSLFDFFWLQMSQAIVRLGHEKRSEGSTDFGTMCSTSPNVTCVNALSQYAHFPFVSKISAALTSGCEYLVKRYSVIFSPAAILRSSSSVHRCPFLAKIAGSAVLNKAIKTSSQYSSHQQHQVKNLKDPVRLDLYLDPVQPAPSGECP